MTTEILRNMLYRGNDVIKNIEWVIFDEIHYINNEDRGAVWEETIIMLPDHIGIVMLSATVQNVMEFVEWVGRIRQRKIYVQTTSFRPVPLEHYVYFKDMVLIKPKDGGFNQNAYADFLKSLKQQKRDHAKFRDDKRQELQNKKQALAEMGNQKDRLRKITGKGQGGGKMNLDYLLKKQVDKANGENARSGGLPEVEGIKTLVNQLKSDNLLPAIFFSFSKKRLTQIVNELERHVSLITPQERAEIEAFYYTAIKRLKKKDQSIYQLTWLKEIMMKGIGIHHGDLLPLGKEIVEILLQRNLIKLLFATDSFAMGLNMPTKTVVFNGLRKHDGTSFRNLLGSEYTQMSGRAGRRGLDEKGLVIAFFHQEKDLPLAPDLGNMVMSKGESLKSKFKMSYSILFNSLSSQSIELDDIIKKSFGEDMNYTEIKNLKAKREEATEELEKVKIKCEFVDIEEAIPVFEYKQQADDLYERSGRFYNREALVRTFGFPKFARIIDDQTYKYFDALIFDFEKAPNQKGTISCYSGVVLRRAAKDGLKPIFLNNERFEPRPASGGKYGQYYKFFVKVPPSNIFSFYHGRFDIDYRCPDEVLIQEYIAFEKAQAQGRVKFQESDFAGSYAEDWASLLSLRDAVTHSKCYVCDLKPQHIGNITTSETKKLVLENIEKQIKECEVVYGYKETEQMRNVLRDLNFVSASFIPQIKARVARELGGGDETLYLTELLMNNVFDKLEPEEIVAVVSVFVAQARSQEETDIESLEIPQTLIDALIKCEEIFMWINETEKKHGLGEEGENGKNKQPQANFLLVKPLFEWAKGKDFVEISEFTEVLEGAIVRTIQRVEQTLRNIKRALTVLGNDTQIQKVDKASAIIKRDIAFALSLYIDENKEILE